MHTLSDDHQSATETKRFLQAVMMAGKTLTSPV